MDIRYSNIGKESLEHFIKRYHSQLKPAGLMSLEAGGIEYIEYVGSSYGE